MKELQKLHCKSLVLSLFFFFLIKIVTKFNSTSDWLKPCSWLVLSYWFLLSTMFRLIVFPQKGSWFAFSQTYTDRKHPCCFQLACEWGLQNRGWQQDCGCLSGGLTNPPDATDTEDNGCACVVGAFLLWITETDLAAAFNGVRVACWLYFITEHRPHRHNKLRQGDLCKSEISSSKANMPDILRQAAPILQSPGRTSKQSYA